VAEIAALQQKTASEVLDGFTWPQYLALGKFWARWPPPTISLAILAKISPYHREDEQQANGDMTDEGMANLLALTGQSLEGLFGTEST